VIHRAAADASVVVFAVPVSAVADASVVVFAVPVSDVADAVVLPVWTDTFPVSVVLFPVVVFVI